MTKQLSRFVKEDMQKAPSERMDSVLLFPYHPDEPTAKMWRALDGLSPKHLDLFASAEYENCYVIPLNTLKHQWDDLESLTLRNICKPDFLTRAPNIFSKISSLTLDYCCCIEDFSTAALKHLLVLENNACDMFCNVIDYTPNVLEVLELESINGLQKPSSKVYESPGVRVGCMLQGWLGHRPDLTSYIPPSLEKLTLRFTRSLSLLYYINDWIEHVCDRTWLPHLKSFQLTVDPESRVEGLEDVTKLVNWKPILEKSPQGLSAEAFDKKFEKKRRVLYTLLKSRPGIDLRT